ncbi:unnamed protein product [Schistocephalus solidus]|uniref:Uncharacterized protein n=1 Tax=Schistocephalus solidus TaxID=70667 RepID=A0A183T1P0_SCHSO|nr:unnamed protein product [Schistocephalus solidus]
MHFGRPSSHEERRDNRQISLLRPCSSSSCSSPIEKANRFARLRLRLLLSRQCAQHLGASRRDFDLDKTTG